MVCDRAEESFARRGDSRFVVANDRSLAAAALARRAGWVASVGRSRLPARKADIREGVDAFSRLGVLAERMGIADEPSARLGLAC